MAFIIERWGARMAPSVVSHDRHFPGARLAAREECSFSCGSLVVVILVVWLVLVDRTRFTVIFDAYMVHAKWLFLCGDYL